MVQELPPGVMERLGFGLRPCLAKFNSRWYTELYRDMEIAEAWRDRPGQESTAQARSGIMWLSGNDGDPPTPMGLAIADMLAGHNLCEGILPVSCDGA